MRVWISKNNIHSIIDFNYEEKYQTLTAKFNNRIFYVNTKRLISKTEAKVVIRKILTQLKRSNFVIKGIKISSLPNKQIKYTLIDTNATLYNSILSYFSLQSMFLNFRRIPA
jgi:hypothetical protein